MAMGDIFEEEENKMLDIKKMMEGNLDSKEFRDSISIGDVINTLQNGYPDQDIFLSSGHVLDVDRAGSNFSIQYGVLITTFDHSEGRSMYFATDDEIRSGRMHQIVMNGANMTMVGVDINQKKAPHEVILDFVRFMKEHWMHLINNKT